MMRCFSLVFVIAFIGLSYGTEMAMNLGDKASEEAWNITSQIYPAAMNIFNSLRASDEDVATNEVDKTARTTGNDILATIYTTAREITTDIMALDDTAENMAQKACATEILKGLYQGAGILSNFLTSSNMESETKGPREGAEEVIKGLYQGVSKIVESAKKSKSVGQVVIDTAM